MSSIEAVARWWLAFTLIAIAFAPIVCWIGAGLGRYRLALVRPVSLVIVTFIVWWPAAMFGLPFQRETLVAALLVGGLAGWGHIHRYRPAIREVLPTCLVFESIWFLALVGFVAFRSANPDIANTEKPMEIALLSSVTLSSDVPAPDPWYAGSPINYYYFGYQSVASLIHLSGVHATMAFNLMLGSLFASTLTVAAGLGAWFAERIQAERRIIWAAGALAGFFVTLAGNLEAFLRLVRSPRDAITAGWWDGVGWQASRVIVDVDAPGVQATINEFPAFSFVLGDLHPHLTTLPVLLSTIALAVGIAASRRFCTYERLAAIGAFSGLLYASNSWDAPVGLVVAFGGLLLAYRSVNRNILIRGATIVLGAFMAALPFALSYTAPVGVGSKKVPGWMERIPVLGTLPNTIAVVTWRPSSTRELLTVHGLWIVIGVAFGLWVFSTSTTILPWLRQHLSVLAPAGLLVVAVALAWSPAALLLGVPAAFFIGVIVLDERAPVRLVSALFASGYGLALVPEYLYIQDSFGNRMNTVFKLHFQAWIFLGVASAAALAMVAASSTRSWRRAGLAGGLIAVLIASPYAILSAEDWMDMGIASGTIDGAAYLATTNPAEASAIAWLARNAGSEDVIVEFPGCAYQSINGVPMNRFSAFTGVPTLLGWANHEGQWRRGEFEDLSAALGARDALANSWLDGQPAATPAGIEPRFVIIGAVERASTERCPQLTPRGQAEIEALIALGWVAAFDEGQTTILVRAGDPVLNAGIE